MNIPVKIFFAISAFISLIISILFLISLVAWIGGGGSVIFPGLGLVVAMWLIVIVLLIMTIISALITFLLYKLIYKKIS